MRQKYFIVILILSAFLAGFACSSANLFLVCISWNAFFYNTFSRFNKKQVIINGFIFGFFYGFYLLNWTIAALHQYSSLGNYSFLVTLLLSIYYGFYYSFLSYLLFWFYNKNKKNHSIFLCLLGVAALFVLVEELFSYFYQGIPFLNFRLGFMVAKSLYLIQLSSIGGIASLSFFVAFTNVLLANFLNTKNRNNLTIALVFITISFFIGYLLFKNNEKITKKNIKVCVVSGNINPKVSWNEETGNELAHKFINLSNQAAVLHPDFIVWPEAILPWAYEKNDDLVQEILKPESKKASITHVLGLNLKEKTNPNKIYASAIFLSNQKNSDASFYIKQNSLQGFEKPLFGLFQIPFLYSDVVVYNNTGNSNPVKTKNGKIGVLICNEAIEQATILDQVKKGATCFFVLSNDGWFKDTYISKYHFYIARIMAVMYNKDFALSSNCGINGFITKNGIILSQKQLDTPLCLMQKISLNNNNTIYANFPYGFITLLLTLLILNILLIFKPQ